VLVELMRVELRVTPTEADGWLNVVFRGPAGRREDVSHVWLVPQPGGAWELECQMEKAVASPTLVLLLAPARVAGLTVYDCDGRLKEVRTAEDLPFTEADGRYYLACRRRFSDLADARAWLARHATLLLALARDE
jgi:hypothetical protein